MSKYNAKYEFDFVGGIDEYDIQDTFEALDKYGPYLAIDADNSTYGGYYVCWLFSDPDFTVEGFEDDPYTFEGELYKYGNTDYLAVAYTIQALRTFGFEDDDIFDFFCAQGREYFGGVGGALLSSCLQRVNAGKYFIMPDEDDWID